MKCNYDNTNYELDAISRWQRRKPFQIFSCLAMHEFFSGECKEKREKNLHFMQTFRLTEKRGELRNLDSTFHFTVLLQLSDTFHNAIFLAGNKRPLFI